MGAPVYYRAVGTGWFIAGAVVVVAVAMAILAFGIHVAALTAWIVVVGAGWLYGGRETKWERAARLQREQSGSPRGRNAFDG